MKQNNLGRFFLSVLLAGALCAGLYYLADATVDVTVAFCYDNIDRGLGPDDTKFNYRNMISEEVLKEVFIVAELPYQPSDAAYFNVLASMPSTVLSTMESKLVNGETYSYYPNQYTITIKTSLWGLSKVKAEKLANAYFEGYKRYFYRHYKYPFVSLNEVTELFNTKAYDYPEITKVLERKLNILRSYYQVFQKEDSQFVSKDGVAFNQVLKAIDLAKEVDLQRISSIINTFQLTKDKDKLIKMYEFMIKRYQNDQNKVNSEYVLTKELLDILKSRENSLVLAGVNGEPITIQSLDSTYDAIAQKATEAIVSSSKRAEDIAYYQNELLKLNEGAIQWSVQYRAIKDIDAMILSLEEKIQLWTELLSAMSDEYFNQKYLGTLTQVGAVSENSVFSRKSYVLVGLLLTTIFYSMMVQASKRPQFPKRERRLRG